MTREEFVPIFKEYLSKYDKYMICGHENPDGDCIGAGVALALALQNMGKEAFLYFDGDTSSYEIASYVPPLEKIEAEALMDARDCAFILVDAADDRRLGDGADLPGKAIDFLCIDHHVRDNIYARMTYVEEGRSSTCEIIFYLLQLAEIPITRRMAEALYTGVAYDTGGFRHPGSNGDTYRMAGQLIDLGADHTRIMNKLFHTRSLKRLKMLGMACRRAKLYEGGILFCFLNQADLHAVGADSAELSGIISTLEEVEDAEVTVFMRQFTEDEVVVSLRSKQIVDVAAVARHYGGGGHVRAAGFSYEGPALVLQQDLLKVIREQLPVQDEKEQALQ